MHARFARIGGGAAGKGWRCESTGLAGTKDSRDAHSASLPALSGAAPSDYPEFAQFLVEQGIDSISLNPDTMLKTSLAILEKERAGNAQGVPS
jgi:hypothetical protein